MTTSLAADRAHFRVTMLEALTFALLSHFDRHPVHASAVVRGGRAVLFVGHSGAGKSTLAYAAAHVGFDVLAEDHAWIQLEPDTRVWGGVHRIKLDHEAAERFPDAAFEGETTSIGGKTKRVIMVSGVLSASDPAICLLSRDHDTASIEPVDESMIYRTLTDHVEPGFDRFPDRHERVARTLAKRGGWRLRLSNDPLEALALVDRVLQS